MGMYTEEKRVRFGLNRTVNDMQSKQEGIFLTGGKSMVIRQAYMNAI
jgi:hypothetical protein